MTDTLPAEYTYEGRLASFKKSAPGPKRRGSAASGRGTKAGGNLTWPHAKYLPAEDLARAGFSWNPSAESPDNVCCFLCLKNLGGWESGDDALEEHIAHSPQCAWAIVAAIEAGIGGYATMDPGDAGMIEARKATFAGMWPHEGKRGWKCKVKQLAEAGWKWTPSLEYDDMATCTYCELALDGWEQGDKPMDEHKKRSPACPFFALMEQYKPLRKAKGKAGRGSKASRTSAQSVTQMELDTTSMADDLHADFDDTALTTASTAGAKKGRAKKATTTAKGRKTKAKKDEPVDPDSDPIAEDEAPPPPPKPTRGRKRASDAIEESIMTNAEAPAPKKRATKARASRTVDNSVVEESNMDVDTTESAPTKAKGKKTARASSTRKASVKSYRSTASMVSTHTAPGAFPDDDEIDRQLEADLERPLTDDEDIMHDSDSERQKAAKGRPLKSALKSEGAKVWLDADHQVDEDDVEEDLQRLEAQLATEQAAAAEEEEEAIVVPKKGRKATGTRKVSKPTKAQRAKEEAEAAARAAQEQAEREAREEAEREAREEAEREAREEADRETREEAEREAREEAEREAREEAEREAREEAAREAREEAEREAREAAVREEVERQRQAKLTVPEQDDDDEEVSLVPEPTPLKEDTSTATVTKKTANARTSTGRKRGRPSKAEVAARLSAQQAEAEKARAAEAEAAAAAEEARATVEPDSFASAHESPASSESVAPTPPPKPMPIRKDKSLPPPPSSPVPPSSVRRHMQHFPSTPRAQASPAQSARQPVVSPSPSPQASDAENQPPSVRPATQKRVALAPVAATPARTGSPSKRNIVAGLRSTTPWTAVDLDMILGSPSKTDADKENGTERLLARGGKLTSPEARMTVEQWIYYNAEQAEEKLKDECESMVSKFEREGTRAMGVLEGMVVD